MKKKSVLVLLTACVVMLASVGLVSAVTNDAKGSIHKKTILFKATSVEDYGSAHVVSVNGVVCRVSATVYYVASSGTKIKKVSLNDAGNAGASVTYKAKSGEGVTRVDSTHTAIYGDDTVTKKFSTLTGK